MCLFRDRSTTRTGLARLEEIRGRQRRPGSGRLRAGLSLRDNTLLDQDLISLGEGTTVTSQLRYAALRIGRELRIRDTVAAVDAARSLVSAGLDIALQPASVPYADERDRVRTLPVEGPWAARSYRLGHLAARSLSPAAEAFCALMTSPGNAETGEPTNT